MSSRAPTMATKQAADADGDAGGGRRGQGPERPAQEQQEAGGLGHARPVVAVERPGTPDAGAGPTTVDPSERLMR